jgi:hypothetical protein
MRHAVSRLRKASSHFGKEMPLASLLPLLSLAVAAVFASAGSAAAGSGYGQLIVNPGTVTPGQSVSILGVCPTNGSTLTGVNSTAFVGGSASITVGSENFTGTATISSTIAAGTYTVTASCGAGSPSVSIVVSAGGGRPTTAPATTQAAPSTPAMAPPSHAAPPPTSAAPTQAGGGMTGGSAAPSRTMASMSAAPSASASATADPAGTTPAPAVTSTGVIRVGLAGHSSPMSAMLSPALVVAAFVLACAMGFLIRRRRRNSSAPHE